MNLENLEITIHENDHKTNLPIFSISEDESKEDIYFRYVKRQIGDYIKSFRKLPGKKVIFWVDFDEERAWYRVKEVWIDPIRNKLHFFISIVT